MSEWIQLKRNDKSDVLLILPCNDGAAHGNYFVPLNPREREWNAWREADKLLSELRKEKRVMFAAVDSSTLEVEEDSKGALVFEYEMERVINPEGEDWGSPSWRWFNPKNSHGLEYLTTLTESLKKALSRTNTFGKIFAVVNPRGYFLSLAAALHEQFLFGKTMMLEMPVHPNNLKVAITFISSFIQRYFSEGYFQGGIISHAALRQRITKESTAWKQNLPERWHYWEWSEYNGEMPPASHKSG